MANGLEIKGLAEFQKSLKELNPELAKTLETELTAVAETIAVGVRRRVPAETGHARASVVAGSEAAGPFVSEGGPKAPYAGWLDFGTRSPRRGRSRSTGPWARTGKGPADGRYIYPQIAQDRDEIIKGATAAFDKAWFAVNL